jgi:hypothetical protein
MSGPTEIVGTCRRAVITGLSRKPEWSEVCGKLTFLKYAGITDKETQQQKYVVYAHAHPPLREAAWMKLFAGAETAEKVSEFEECEMYRDFERDGLLKTLGKPLRKDVVREKIREKNEKKNNTINKKRKAEGRGNVQSPISGTNSFVDAVEAAIRVTKQQEAAELEEARDQIRALEDENRQLRSELARNSKRKASEMCADEEADEAVDSEADEAVDEEAAEVKCVTIVARPGTEMLNWWKQKEGEAGYKAWVENGLRERLLYLAGHVTCDRVGTPDRAVAAPGHGLKLSEWRALFEFANVTVERAEWIDAKEAHKHHDELLFNHGQITFELKGAAWVRV